MPGLAGLPRELLLNIFTFLDEQTLLDSVSLLCKRLSLISRDSLLWHALCKSQHYNLIEYPLSNLHPSNDYWEEYCYQEYVNRVVSHFLRQIVSTPSTREFGVVAIPRIGLRARVQLVKTLNSETSTLREKYYARELIYAINQRHAVIEILYMFSQPNNFDPFKFLLAFDSFYLDRPCTCGPSSEETYSEYIDTIKSVLIPLKNYTTKLNEKSSVLNQSNRISNSDRKAIRDEYILVAQKFGSILYEFDLINDISVRTINPGNVSGLFLFGIFHNQRPSISLISAIIYHYFAKWVGIPASIVVLDFDAYIRIEDPTYNAALENDIKREDSSTSVNNTSNAQIRIPAGNADGSTEASSSFNEVSDSECFFVDVNRAGKIRDVSEMNGIIGLGRGRHTSLYPSSNKDIVDVFMRHLTDGYTLHQDSSLTSAVMFSGVMIISFISIFAEKNKQLVPTIAPQESNNLRNIKEAVTPLNLSKIPSIDPNNESPINNNTAPNDNFISRRYSSESGEEMTHLYTMAIASLTNQIPCNFNLVYDFLFRMADDIIPVSDKLNTIEHVCSQLHIIPSTAEKDYNERQSRQTIYNQPKYHLGQVVYSERSGRYGVIIGWSYVPMSRNGFRSIATRSVSDGSTPSRSEFHVQTAREVGSTSSLSEKKDGHNHWHVQYVVLQSSYDVVRVLQQSIILADYPFSKLLGVAPQFFSIGVGKYFTTYDEKHRLFVPGTELLSSFKEECEFFESNSDVSRFHNDTNVEETIPSQHNTNDNTTGTAQIVSVQ